MTDKNKKIYIFSILVVLLSLFITFVPEFNYSVLAFELLVQSRPFISIILLLVVLFLVLKRHYLTAIVPIICVVVNIFWIFDGYSGIQTSISCPDGINSTSVRVFSFNTYYKNKKYDEVLQAIESAEADIVFLTEVEGGLYRYGHERLLHKYSFHYSELEQGIAHGKAVYSKYPIAFVEKQKLTGSSHRVLRAKININDQIVNFIGIHTYSPKNTWRIQDRNKHIGALKAYIMHLEQAGEGIIVAGDFNTAPWHPVMREMKEQTRLNNNGFYNIVGTWPTWLPSFLTIPIDHIFHNNVFGHSKYYQGLWSGSDHYPVYVDLEMCK